jgi:hypothetical protein
MCVRLHATIYRITQRDVKPRRPAATLNKKRRPLRAVRGGRGAPITPAERAEQQARSERAQLERRVDRIEARASHPDRRVGGSRDRRSVVLARNPEPLVLEDPVIRVADDYLIRATADRPSRLVPGVGERPADDPRAFGRELYLPRAAGDHVDLHDDDPAITGTLTRAGGKRTHARTLAVIPWRDIVEEP